MSEFEYVVPNRRLVLSFQQYGKSHTPLIFYLTMITDAQWRIFLHSQATYGRRRESIADLEEQINDIFINHKEAHLNHTDTPVIPAHSLPEVIAELSSRYGVEVLDRDEEQKVAEFVQDNPGIEVTPELLLGFIAMATAKNGEGRSSQNPSPDLDDEDITRGRNEEREHRVESRSSSTDSASTSVGRHEPRTPGSRGPESPFEAKSRQRSAPLSGPPSSWTKRPAPANRRRSDSGGRRGSMSDTEVCYCIYSSLISENAAVLFSTNASGSSNSCSFYANVSYDLFSRVTITSIT